MPHSVAIATPSEEAEATDKQRRGMRHAIAAQVFGAMATIIRTNGVVLLYLTSLELPPARVVAYLSIPAIGTALLTTPVAWFGERYGKRRIMLLGSGLTSLGCLALALAASLAGPWVNLAVLAGLMAEAIGSAMTVAVWFALLSPIVPVTMRGRFFGKLRSAWQSMGIVATLLCAAYLSASSELWTFQAVIAAVGVFTAIRLYFVGKVPEIEPPGAASRRPQIHVARLLRRPGYLSFCAYLFLLATAVTCGPAMMALVEKEAMGLPDGTIVFLGMLSMIGATIGFLFGGRAVDRWSTRPVFLFSHFGYALLMLVFVLRDSFPCPVLWTVGTIHFLFGAVAAASSVAVSSEMLALIPPKNKGMSTSVCLTMQQAGGALSGMLAAGALHLHLLAQQWQLGSATLSSYDAILLVLGVAVLLLVVTLGLVPSVLGKAQWLPR